VRFAGIEGFAEKAHLAAFAVALHALAGFPTFACLQSRR
jgi:hypothetical protein